MRRFLPLILTLSLIVVPQMGLTQTVEQLFEQGVTQGSLGNYAEAERIFRRIIEINPNDAKAYNNLGLALRDQGKLEKAIANYQTAIQLNSNYAEAYNN